ncbi:MAG: alcohol dehydrogenase catalytic domain-containing protein [Rhodobacteraceae bacterium]|nr:alcohol dehydrogenase catalytic domain-containing protein [Paracoccaceae bacterium]
MLQILSPKAAGRKARYPDSKKALSKKKAALCTRFPAPLEVLGITLAPPRQGKVEVTLAACAICHSDLHVIEGACGGSLPAVYGHEAAGSVTAMGDSAGDYQIGQRVLITLIRACGTCPC